MLSGFLNCIDMISFDIILNIYAVSTCTLKTWWVVKCFFVWIHYTDVLLEYSPSNGTQFLTITINLKWEF